MLRTIEKFNGHVIQKITKPDGSIIAYQVGPAAAIGKDANAFDRYKTLVEARKALGVPAPESKHTPPKTIYAQNQKGYDPHRR